MGDHFTQLGRGLVITGAIIAVLGIIILILPRIPWLGRLPGDIYLKRENFTLYVPLTTGLIVSLVISLILYLFRR